MIDSRLLKKIYECIPKVRRKRGRLKQAWTQCTAQIMREWGLDDEPGKTDMDGEYDKFLKWIQENVQDIVKPSIYK